VMSELPQVLTNVTVGSKNGWDQDEVIAATIAEWEKQLGTRGRILVRPSGTEPMIRVRVVAPTAAEAAEAADAIAQVVRSALG